ncbi:hypothetical protein [Flavobacterium sp. ACAM 123]|jgi:hypothetical protein|uniref:hypothetical protein n=1 Tax=Flavobacterium sp. ACAM 123 TaxID=1189620 RepID=UPI0002F3A9A3|nr:hypothetical protein [Flavobacterium sp. ACAM 123]
MKKRLEADLVSIAHKILQLKNKSDINQLFLETQKLYEKLSVLRFVNEHYGAIKPTLTHAEIEEEIEALYDNNIDLPLETMIEMTGFTPVEKAMIASTVIKEIPAEEVYAQDPIATEEPIDKKSNTEAEEEITAEDVDDLGDFAADIVEQPVEDIEEIEEEGLGNEIDTEETWEEAEEEIAAKELQEEKEEEGSGNEIDTENTAEEAEEKITDKEVHEEELTAEDVDELGDFAADIAEQPVEEIEETAEEPAAEFKAAFELTKETEVETPKHPQTMQISFEDLLGGPYSEPDFVKVDEIEALPPETVFEALEKIEEKKTPPAYAPAKIGESKTVSLNDKFSKGIDIDLNDRIAFVKHLFGNSSEDYNRVLNQLITFDNFYETRNFIEEMVKPDYNNWEGKDDYAERFMDIIEKKFL